MNWVRVETPPALLALGSPDMRVFQTNVRDDRRTPTDAREPDGWHLSISHRRNDRKPGRLPTWDEVVDARYRFCPAELTMAMLLPPKDEYVNVHPTTFHLWEIP